MKTFKFVVLLTGLIAAPALYAECAISLPYDKLVDCIVKENAAGIRQLDFTEEQATSKQEELRRQSQPSKVVDLQVQKQAQK